MATNYVRIYYGPVESFGLNAEFRPQFLFGIRRRLRRLGYRVDLVPVHYINYCMLAICGFMVFHCNIRNLWFNAPIQLDAVCQRAVDAVLDATARLQRARNYLWTWNMLDEQIFKRSDYAPKEYWISDIQPTPEELQNILICKDCCGIQTAKLKAQEPLVQETSAELVLEDNMTVQN